MAKRRAAMVFLPLLLLTPLPVAAQESAEDLRRRIEVLEEQVRTLQAELASLRTTVVGGAGAVPSDPSAPPPSTAPTPVPASGASTGQALPVYGGPSGTKALNPDVGVIGNFITAAGNSRGGTDAVAPAPFMTLQESEASFQAIVDPYARADFFLAIGEEGIEVEEGFVTFPTLPGGLLVKAGKMRANFGRLNAFHNHTLPWTDRPLVMYNLLGGATDDPDTGIKDAGVSVSRLVPAGKVFLEATAELFRGDSGSLFVAGRRQDSSVVGHVRSYADLSESSNLELGGSYARGHNDSGAGFVTQLYGADLTYRWKPLRRAIYRSFAARGEAIWSLRDEPGGRQRAFGGFLSADYKLARRWFAGLRYDWSERARQARVNDDGMSAVLTFWPSEFTQLRAQYRRVRFGDEPAANELFLQTLFTIGAHGAHPF